LKRALEFKIRDRDLRSHVLVHNHRVRTGTEIDGYEQWLRMIDLVKYGWKKLYRVEDEGRIKLKRLSIVD